MRFTLDLEKKVFPGKYEESLWTIFLGLIMGILTISFIIWNRLIREALPKDLTAEQPFTFRFCIIVFFFVYMTLGVILQVNSLQKKLRGITTKSRIFTTTALYLQKRPKLVDMLQFVLNYILSAPLYLWRFCFFNLNFKNTYTNAIVEFFYHRGIYLWENFFPGSIEGYYRETLATVILVYIPRIIVFSVFLFETLIYKKIEVFYYVAIILLIPLMFLGYRRILMDIGYFTLERFHKTIMKVTIVGTNKEYDYFGHIADVLKGIPCNDTYEFTKRSPEVSDEDFIQADNAYLYVWEILKMSFKFYKVGEKYDYIERLLISVILMISFLLWILIIFQIY